MTNNHAITNTNFVKSGIKYALFLFSVGVLAFSVWYSPILFKGSILSGAEGNIILARNLAQTGIRGTENDLNVLLSSNLVKDQAHISTYGNKLTTVLYSWIFKIWGEFSENELVLLSMSIYALALMVFTLIVLYLFGFKTSLIFSLIYILLPFNWQLSNNVGSYEFALLFFALFFLFYFLGLNKKYNYLYLIPAGIFLALACLARETFFLFIPFFLFYLWWKNPKRFLLYIFIPFLILFSYFWLPDALMMKGGGNSYLLIFNSQAPEKLKSADSTFYSHHFPDPYTYYFNREEFLEKSQSELTSPETSFFTKVGSIKSATNNGFMSPSFLERLEVGLVLFSSHLSRFFSLEDIGGPFIFLLMLLGIYNLKQKNRYLFGLALGWILSVIFLLSFVILAGRQHLMDFNWILALFIALGLIMLAKIINQYFNFNQRKSRILFLVVVLSALYGLVVANHAAWNRLFEGQEASLKITAYSQKIKELNIPDEDVIAISKSVNRYRLNYLSNKSLVIFREETIRDLLDNGELASAFEKFKVKYILGYSPDISEEVIAKTRIVNVADDSVEIPQIETTPAKVWFLNLIK